MPGPMTCYACDKEPTQQCPRCGRPYCDEHGEDFCGICLEPSSGVPSFNLYRGSLLALIVGAVLALWLIIQPTGGATDSGPKLIVLTPTSAAPAARTTTPAGTPVSVVSVVPAGATTAAGTPAAGATTAVRTGTPGTAVVATGTARPATTAPAGTTPAAPGDYVVVSGDTLSSICANKLRLPPGMTVQECIDRIKSLNNLTSDSISIDAKLKVPQ